MAVVAAFLLYTLLGEVMARATELSFNEFIVKLSSGEITELYVDAYNWTGLVIDANGKTVATYTTVGPSVYNYVDFQYGLR